MNNLIYTKLSYGVYVITSKNQEKLYGCVANSAMQITDKPSTIAVSINHNNATHKAISESGLFAINILQEDCDPKIIGTFGFNSCNQIDKFEHVDYEMKHDVPVLKKVIGHLVLKVINTMETPTHTVFLGEVIDGDLYQSLTPMTYKYYHEVVKGKTPKNAPTYVAEEKVTDKWVCSICGYVYDGDIPFEELGDDYTCPICYQSKDLFVKK
ncbi:MAG: flavin reductase [Traorella sp.]